MPGDIGRKIDLGSLRAGGASWLLLVSEDSELTRRRGPLDHHKGDGNLHPGGMGNSVFVTPPVLGSRAALERSCFVSMGSGFGWQLVAGSHSRECMADFVSGCREDFRVGTAGHEADG